MNKSISGLLEWAKTAIACENVRCMHFSTTGRGLGATSPIKPGTICLRFKQQIIISSQKVQATPFACAPDASDKNFHSKFLLENEPPVVCLTFWLLFLSMQPKSGKFQPYLNTLPTHYANPLYVCEMLDETGGLFAEFLAVLIENEQHDLVSRLQTQHSELSKTVDRVLRLWQTLNAPKIDLPSYQAVIWAFFTAQTRCLYYAFDDNKTQISSSARAGAALVPFFDLINHNGHEPNVDIEVDACNGDVIVRATRDIQPGEQIFFSYGDHSPEALFVDYGYVPADDEQATAVYKIDTNELVERVKIRHACEAFGAGTYAQQGPFAACVQNLHADFMSRSVISAVGEQCTLVVEKVNFCERIKFGENSHSASDTNLPWQLLFIARLLLKRAAAAANVVEHAKTGNSPTAKCESNKKTSKQQEARLRKDFFIDNFFSPGEQNVVNDADVQKLVSALFLPVFKQLYDDERQLRQNCQRAMDNIFDAFLSSQNKTCEEMQIAVESVRTCVISLCNRKTDCLRGIVSLLEKI